MQRTQSLPQGEVLISPGEGETYDSNTSYEGEEGQEEGEHSDDWYAILGVDTKASQSDIKDAYHKLVRVYHPDKIIRARTMSDPNIPREEIQNVRQDAIERFNKITQAYDVLGDPIQRAMYDYVYGVRAESTEERLHFNSMRRKLAEGAVALMEETVIAIREQEQAKSGLLILEGRYGDLTSKQGNYIDVTVPLQCMVMDSSLIIQPGNSKQWLEGFYEPTINTECELYIRYKFLNKMHQVTVGDMDKLIIPLQEHLMSDQEANRVDQQSRNKSLVVKRLKKRRRYMLYTSLVFAIGYYLIRTNRIKLPFGWTLPALPLPNVPTTFISTWQTWFERKSSTSSTSTPAITAPTPALSSSLTMASSRLS